MPVSSIKCCECAQTCEGNSEGKYLLPRNLNLQKKDNFSDGPCPLSSGTSLKKKGYGKIEYEFYNKSWTYTEYHVQPEDEDPYEEFEELCAEGNLENSEDQLDIYLLQLPQTSHQIDFKYLCHGCASKGGWQGSAPCKLCQTRAQA